MVFYGGGVEDSFLGENGIEFNLQQALYEELNLCGFQQIVYSAPHRALYYLDSRSQDLSSQQLEEDSAPIPERQMVDFMDGPLGQYLYLRQPNRGVQARQRSLQAMGDPFLIKHLNLLMTQPGGAKTAIIISQAETMLNTFSAKRLLAGFIGEWVQLPESNQNICIMIFTAKNQTRLMQSSATLTVPEIRDQICLESSRNSVMVAEISGPQEDEILRLFDFLKRTGKYINESEIEKIIQIIIAEGGSLRQWLSRLKALDLIDIASLRSKGWFRVYQERKISAWEELESLTGLEEVKERILELKAWFEVRAKSPAHRDEAPNLHMVFMGNPGTGKTTLARLFGEILFEIGVLKKGHLIEATGKDLIADYVGRTALKTTELVDRALDGVLFIDEAYVLTEAERGGFGQEAVDTLLARIENDRERLVVILAGYPARMRHFLGSNPGLARRFPQDNLFSFPDFDPQELLKIFEQRIQAKNLQCAPEARGAIEQIIQSLCAQKDESFGNAGEMRTLVDSIDRRRASRMHRSNDPHEPLVILEDISPEYRSYLNTEPPPLEIILRDLDESVGLEAVKNHIKNWLTN